MTAPAYLDDAAIERLADLLEQRAVPFKGFNLEALDGFLSALAVGPDTVPMSEWEPAVWGTPPRWSDPTERADVERLLMGHRNMADARVRHGGDDLPDHLAPLLWLPEDPELKDAEAEQEDDLDVGRDWALGFYRGVDLRSGDWDRWLDSEDWVDEIFELLERLATGVVAGEEEGDVPQRLSYRERLEITASLPAMLADLAAYKAEQAGRSSGR